MIEFTRPLALILLVLLPVFVLIDWRSQRARTRLRHYFSLGIRLLGFTILVVALAAPVIWTGTDTLSTVFLLDRSASVSPVEQQQAIDWIEQAIQTKHPNDRAAVISFAGDAAVEQGLSASPAALAPSAKLDTSHTDIASALRLAEGVLPQGGARRIVLLSDGNENVGNALSEAPLLRAAGIPVDAVPLTDGSGAEVAVRSLDVPPAIHQGERFTSEVTITSTVETTARLRLLIDGRLDSTRTLNLHVGENNLVLAHDPLPSGEHALEAIVEPDRDTIAENNVAYATLQVAGPPRVLLVEGDPGNAKYLSKALAAAGLSADVEAPSILGGDVASLRRYDAIGLVNVPATEIGADGLLALQSYVRDFGGGLVVVGGDRSYGAGSYRNTPLEDTLPVSMDVRGRKTQANVSLVLVIDTSGSMSEGPPGATKIELAREAALGATKELSDQDEVGIVAFDSSPHWIYHTQPLTNRTAVDSAIESLQPGGGTQIYPALQAAYNEIITRPTKVKHIILMTDGLAPNGPYPALTAQMRAHGVTLSTIAIGTDADVSLLQSLADWGRGRFYDARDPLDVPSFVLKETAEVARAAVTEETFTPTVADQTPILGGISSIPPLYGYVATTPKPSAVVGLQSPEDDPILAQWHYGLGRSVAFTSDASARWSAAWVSWNGFSQFWGQVFGWVMPAPQGKSLQIQTSLAAGKARVEVTATDESGHFIDNAPTTATIAGPTGPTKTIPLEQVAPGTYAADVPADTPGAYLVQVSQTVAGQPTPARQTAGFSVPYSPEFAGLPTNVGLLQNLAASTGGAILTSPAESFAHNLRPADAAEPIWPALVIALIPLFLLDVAIRRLRFAPTDLLPVVERLRARWRGRVGPATHFATRLAASRRERSPSSGIPRRPADASARPEPVAARPTASASPAAPTNAPPASRLLAAKRRAGAPRAK